MTFSPLPQSPESFLTTPFRVLTLVPERVPVWICVCVVSPLPPVSHTCRNELFLH